MIGTERDELGYVLREISAARARRERWVNRGFRSLRQLWYVAVGWVGATKMLGGTQIGYVALGALLGIAYCVVHIGWGIARAWVED